MRDFVKQPFIIKELNRDYTKTKLIYVLFDISLRKNLIPYCS